MMSEMSDKMAVFDNQSIRARSAHALHHYCIGGAQLLQQKIRRRSVSLGSCMFMRTEKRLGNAQGLGGTSDGHRAGPGAAILTRLEGIGRALCIDHHLEICGARAAKEKAPGHIIKTIALKVIGAEAVNRPQITVGRRGW